MKTKVLMVCLGNICRSPLAEGLLKSKVDADKIEVDSAGTSNYHVDGLPDERSIATARKHGLDITSQRGRQFSVEDFDEFDYIFVMDKSNHADILSLARTKEEAKKVDLILNKIYPNEQQDVPDPYYGGDHGFENVYQMLDQVTDIIAKEIS